MTRRDHAYLDKPLLKLPDGTLIFASDVRRIHIHAKQWAYLLIFLLLLLIGSFDGPMP